MHKHFIKRCLEIAELGKGMVSPNPMVGAVIVFKNLIIGEGYHEKYGGPHAEVNAINSVSDKSLLAKSTIYVSLEPCSHFGKTPPCADLIIENQIPKVVIATIDSNALVCGNGISKLKAAGIDVITGVLEKEAIQLNKYFNTFHQKKRPYITLKWAETANGFIDINRHNSATKALKISNSASSRWVHKLRSETDAILIGKNTAFLDNPSLTTRNWFGKNPVRIVIDKKLELPNNLKLWDKSVSTLVYNSLKANKEINLELIKIDFENFIPSLLKDLWERNIQSILIEGGRFTIQEFIDQQIWDDLFVIKSSNQIENGVNAPTTNSNLLHSHSVDTDLIQHYELSL